MNWKTGVHFCSILKLTFIKRPIRKPCSYSNRAAIEYWMHSLWELKYWVNWVNLACFQHFEICGCGLVYFSTVLLWRDIHVQSNKFEIFILFIPCIVNDLQILTIPANAPLYYYVFEIHNTITVNILVMYGSVNNLHCAEWTTWKWQMLNQQESAIIIRTQKKSY